MAEAAIYHVTGLRGSTQIKKRYVGAPKESYLCSWAFANKFAMVVRYWPSKKGWMILDTRKTENRPIPTRNNGTVNRWQGQVRLPKIYPTEDAAVMAAIYIQQRL